SNGATEDRYATACTRSARSACAARSARGLILGDRTVGDRQDDPTGTDGAASRTCAYNGCLRRHGTRGQSAAHGLVALEGRIENGRSPARHQVHGPAFAETKGRNPVGAGAANGLVAHERAVADGEVRREAPDATARAEAAIGTAEGLVARERTIAN